MNRVAPVDADLVHSPRIAFVRCGRLYVFTTSTAASRRHFVGHAGIRMLVPGPARHACYRGVIAAGRELCGSGVERAREVRLLDMVVPADRVGLMRNITAIEGFGIVHFFHLSEAGEAGASRQVEIATSVSTRS